MHLIERNSLLWHYLDTDIRNLIADGEAVLDLFESCTKRFVTAEAKRNDVKKNTQAGIFKPAISFGNISDFSFLVFPFAKAYEGFLKKFLLDTKLIHVEDYYSDDIRIGRILNPHFIHETSNVFNRICDHSREGVHISHRLWDIWKRGRNTVFHFFPHNFKKLSYSEAVELVKEIINSMNTAVTHCRVDVTAKAPITSISM